MIQDASRRRVQSARSTTIAGSATAVIISSMPARNTPDAQDGEQHERVPAGHGVHPRECIRDRRSLPAGAGVYQRIVTPPETLGTRVHASQ